MENLSSVLSLYGDRVLLAYGSGSIRRNGVYDQVMNTLQACGRTVTEFSGILPNPTYEKVLEGGRLARASQADLILAVGGGSVIDCAKGVAIAAVEEGDIWTKYWQNKQPLDCTPLPIGAVLTMVGTGSEMDGDAVITHEATKRKTSCWDYSLYPQFAILNPEFTYSVPEYQMVSGIFDTLSHIMEIYFSPRMRTISPMTLQSSDAQHHPQHPCGHCHPPGLCGSEQSDVGLLPGPQRHSRPLKEGGLEVHQIQHQIAAYYPSAHGMGLAAISPAYYRLVCPYGLPRFRRFATQVWGIDPTGKRDLSVAHAGIDALAAFIRESHMVTSLRDLVFQQAPLQTIADTCNLRRGGYYTLTRDDVLRVLQNSL